LRVFYFPKNQEYLAKEEGIHVCQANLDQYSIDNQDGDGAFLTLFKSVHRAFLQPAQGRRILLIV